MVITNFSVNYVNFQPHMPQLSKTYAVGVMFDSELIDAKINSTQRLFVSNFISLFLVPFMLIVSAMFIVEVAFLVQFSRKIFRTINELYNKIDLLNKHYRKINKKGRAPREVEDQATQMTKENVKSIENELSDTEEQNSMRRKSTQRSQSVAGREEAA